MGSTSSRGAIAAVAGLACITASCGTGADTDPRALAAEFPPPYILPYDEIEPATGHIYDVAEPVGFAAPMAESAPLRVAAPDPELVVVAVGRGARESFSSAVAYEFEELVGDASCKPIQCTDREAVELLTVGHADFGVISGALSQRDIQSGIRQTPLGVELFALAVPQGNPVRSLDPREVRSIFTGGVANWRELGHEAGAVVAIVPSEQRLLDRASRSMIPGDRFASTCVRADDEDDVTRLLQQHPGAIALVRLTDTPRSFGQKLLEIDWTAPSADAFSYGTYPFGAPVQLITAGTPTPRALDFLSYARSDRGRARLGDHLSLPR